jgi:hypothetical protein
MNTETKTAFNAIIEHNAKQTSKVLGALEQLTEWMNTIQCSIINIDKRLNIAEKTNECQDKESEFYVTKEDFKK